MRGIAPTLVLSVIAVRVVSAAWHQREQKPDPWHQMQTCQNATVPLPDKSASLLQGDFFRSKSNARYSTQRAPTRHVGQTVAATILEIDANTSNNVKIKAHGFAELVQPTYSMPPLPVFATSPSLEPVFPWGTAQQLKLHLGVQLARLGTYFLQTSSDTNFKIVSIVVVSIVSIVMMFVLVYFCDSKSRQTQASRSPLPRRSINHFTRRTKADENVHQTTASVSRLSSYCLPSAMDLPQVNCSAVHVPPLAQASPLPTQTLESPLLCPEFIVPAGTECTLLIPPLPLAGNNFEGECTIDDIRKLPIFRAIFKRCEVSHSEGGNLHGRHCMILESVTATEIFARCGPSVVDMVCQPMELQIFRKTEEPFGVIRRSSASGLFSVFSHSRGNWLIHFHDDLSRSPVHAYNENGALLAILEIRDGVGEERQRSIRIAPLCDAGLMVTTVLGALLLQQETINNPPLHTGSVTSHRPSSGPS